MEIFNARYKRRSLMTGAGMLLVIFGLLILPDFSLLAKELIWNAFFGGLLLGVAVTLVMLTSTNGKEIRDIPELDDSYKDTHK